MKKIFTSVLFALAMMGVSAEEYTCPLMLSIAGSEDTAAGNINVTVNKQEDGKYTMLLKNFSLGEQGVGTIEVKDVEAVTCGNTICLSSQQTIQITAGDDETKYWMGPGLGDLSILLKGQLKGDKFNAILNIPIAGGMIVGVKLGEDANNMSQLPNSGFEEFHTAKASSKITSDEPNGWHSFMSCTGKLAAMVQGTTHTFIDTNVREGAEETNTKCVKIISSGMDISLLGLSYSANGTITTGRLQAADMSASNQSNCSFLKFENTNTDGNGDPFYAVLNNKPDSIKVWVKHHAGKGNTKNTYATVSALLTNGEYAQDPQIEQYKENIIAEANTTTIEAKDEWEQISIPFTYSNTQETPKAALVTMSTCSVPGGGSKDNNDPDVLYVDDVELVYNAAIKSVSMNGKEIDFDEYNSAEIENYEGEITPDKFTVEAEGAGAYVTTKINADADDPTTVYATITVTSNDLKKYDVRMITFTGVSTGIAKTSSSVMPTGVKAIYNLSGQKVSSMGKAGAYIIQRTDGTTVKVLKK